MELPLANFFPVVLRSLSLGSCKIDFSALGADVEADQPKLNIEVVNPQEAEGVLRNAESGNVKPLFKYFGADWSVPCR